MRVFENERGISNLIATLILIAIAIVGGAFAYTVFRDQAQTTTTSADLQVQDLTVQDVGGSTYCSTTMKNVGSQRLTGVKVIVSPSTETPTITLGDELPAAEDNFKPMNPGVTSSSFQNGTDNNGILNAGETYAIRITASTPDGSITRTMTVRVKS